MGTNLRSSHSRFALFNYERDFILSLVDNNQVCVIEALNSTLGYLDDLLNIDNP